ncbi:unnamed protein product [Brassicogethes aeneus]|uniref:Transcriptional-regulating factor 1 n=1 Tax=Brassicogethes aeneus TaxID=1431903 RepID=A0A9P0AU97_BRAAE|nr:unnamed protein product [Brassicogethes aeneus]
MCGKAFKRQDHLNGHMLTHRNKKPYECKAEGCGKSYCDARSLRRHTENHHSGSGGSTSNVGGSSSTTMSPAQGAASGDAASPHGSSCIQYAPPPTSTSGGVTSGTAGKSQLQQLLAVDPAKGSSTGNNDGLTKQQLDLIHQIMEQTQRQSQQATASAATTTKTTVATSTKTTKVVTKTPVKLQRVFSSQSSNKSSSNSSGQQSKVSTTTPNSGSPKNAEPKPVECNLCHRKFKNIPALNGHMRLHGGYFKKDSENKKCEKKDNNAPPLQTASVSVRALIEEKIINKRTTQPAPAAPSSSAAQTAPNNNTTDETTGNSGKAAPPLFPLKVHSSGAATATTTTAPAAATDLDAKVTSFVVPAPPQQADKTRRHSDAEAFTHREKSTVKRTTSDPGQSNLLFNSNDSFTLTYKQEEVEYLSPSLQDEVFTQVQDTMLLQGVDPNQLATLQFQTESLLPDQNESMQNINLDDYTIQDNVHSPSFQSSHNQDLQAVLDSPLPESLAEFSTFHSANNLDLSSPSYHSTQSPVGYAGSPHTSIAQSPLQSPLIRQDSPGFAYPTPPASHEGQSPCFSQSTMLPMVSPKQEFGAVVERGIDEPPQASSPLSAAFFTSTMSSSAAVEEALEEVLPGESITNDDIYPLSSSPSPQSPIGLTPVQSPLPISSTVSSPLPPTTFTVTNSNGFNISPQYTLQSQMMPNSEDPLLSSSSITRKRFELNGIPLRVVTNNGLLDLNSANFAGILLDANGELKFIQTGANLQTKNFVLANAQVLHTQEDDKNKMYRVSKTVQCAMPKQFVARPKQVLDLKKEEGHNVFLSPTTLPSSPVRASRKRPRSEPLQLPVFHQSKLRATRSKPAGSSPFTPQPILNPQRQGTGLFNGIKNKNEENSIWSCEPIPETDSTPHINVGPKFQCNIPVFQSVPDRLSPVPKHEDLLWDPGINNCSDSEVEIYLDFACCAAVPGGGRNKEYAMHLLHMCGGNIHDAMLRLMQPSPNLPADHPLLCYHYTESDKWSSTETDVFHKAVAKYDKDFHSISKEIKSKSVKQCIQFYYVWKKVCTDEYRKLKLIREKKNNKNSDDMDEKPYPDAKLLGSFNSRAALNGHIRIHGGSARNSPTPKGGASAGAHAVSSTVCHPDSTEDYPCKICGKVFTKIKSRSAHMKSHRPPDAEPSKRREPKEPQNFSMNELSVPSPYSAQ